MAIVQVTIVPLGTQTTSLSQYVANCHEVLEASGLTYQLTPMNTVIEGDLDEILAIVKKMHEVPFENGAMRVSTEIKIDDRRDQKGSMKQKLNSVTSKLKK
jgi:uncharacterized protein (TIGR00106 family)